jgi:nicotinate phosphoribosyltransferase
MLIKSMLDNDLYKFTMQQAVFHRFYNDEVKYKFVCRNKNISFEKVFEKIKTEITALRELTLSASEEEYLRSIRFVRKDYVNFLKLFRFDPASHVNLMLDDAGGLEIEISGSWLYTILYEVPVLAIVNEVYFSNLSANENRDELYKRGEEKLYDKAAMVKDVKEMKIIDFGTRRRFSFEWHDRVVGLMKTHAPDVFTGTSNVHLAMKYGLTPVGTMAHEWLMAGQAQEIRLASSQKFMLEYWVGEYRGDLGIALTDTISMDAFLNDFDLYFAKLYDGCRHDSGDPYIWADKLITHYEKLKIDPATKTAVFSDGLDFSKALAIYERYKDKIKTSFGIGTNLTNDVGYVPLNIVIKMTECNGQKVAKLSDEPGKSICNDEKFLDYLKYVFKYDL